MVKSPKSNVKVQRLSRQMKGKLEFAMALFAYATCVLSAMSADEPLDRDTRRGMMHAIQAGEIRRMAMEDISGLVGKGVFSPASADAWRAIVADADPEKMRPLQFAPMQVEDFFAGAHVLPGPYDGAGAVFAYYNPWWDTLLFVKTSGGKLPDSEGQPSQLVEKRGGGPYNFLLEEVGDAAATSAKTAPTMPAGRRGTPPRVDSFAWVSGETFRGEKVADGRERIATVIPLPDEPMSKALWRVETATVSRFRERFPEGGGHALQFDKGVAEVSFAEEFDVIQSRAALRLKLASELMNGKTNAAVCARCCALLRSADERELRRNFDSYQHRFFCRTLAKIPAKVREGFVPYGFVPGDEGSLFVFVSRDMPRFYATVSFPKDRLSGPFAGAVEMEWFDLGEAGALLDAVEPTGGVPLPAAEKEGGAQ